MTHIQRIERIVHALLMLACAVVMLLLGEAGYLIVTFLLSAALLLLALRFLVYYCTMARHMVDGLGVLFQGLLLLNFGILTLSVSQNEGVLIALYLLGVRAFNGVIAVLRSLEARSMRGSWRLRMSDGVINLICAAAAVVFGLILKDLRVLTWIYALGLIYSAAAKIISAFRKTSIVYIQ